MITTLFWLAGELLSLLHLGCHPGRRIQHAGVLWRVGHS